MKTPRTLLVMAALALGTAACGDADSAPRETATDTDGAASVTVADNRFDAGDLTVAAGSTVTWQWADGASRHNVHGDGFESPTQEAGTFAHRFDVPGTYEYRCTLHHGMDATIAVVP